MSDAAQIQSLLMLADEKEKEEVESVAARSSHWRYVRYGRWQRKRRSRRGTGLRFYNMFHGALSACHQLAIS